MLERRKDFVEPPGSPFVEQYAVGRSLRELSELTDRSLSAVRNILDRRGIRRRGSGAPVIPEPGT
jgi:hypothetical protein